MKRVVVTGFGAVTPLGNDIASFAAGLREGRSGAKPITLYDASRFKTHFACELKDFIPETYIDRKEVRRLDRFAQMAIYCAAEAVSSSGLDFAHDSRLDHDRIGVIWGSGIGGIKSLEEEIQEYCKGDGTPRYSPFMIPKMISDIAAGHISMRYGLRGINYATVSACASATHAIISAMDAIRVGRNDMIITGGSEASITEAGMGGFGAMKALSTRNDDYLTASRPFDKDRDGFVLGEGGACLILESLEHARSRGALILAEIAGGGATADAYHLTAPHPEGLGATQVMTLALQDASLNTQDVDYVNVHGTSTPLGDIAETKAIQKVFRDHAYRLNISSTKSMTGHLLGAAGAVEAVASILAIQQAFVPPTINHFTDDPDLDPRLNFTFNEAQSREIRVALSNTFGFGGHNACVIFKKFE